jgi:hypothetical protein
MLKKGIVFIALILLLASAASCVRQTTTSTETFTQTPVFTLSSGSLTLAIGSSSSLTYESNVTGTEVKIAWRASPEGIVSIDPQGRITGILPGNAVVELLYLQEVVATCTVIVASDVELVAPRKTTYLLGETLNLRGSSIRLLDESGLPLEDIALTESMLSNTALLESGEIRIDVSFAGSTYSFFVFVLSEKQAVSRFDDFILLTDSPKTLGKLEFAFTKSDLNALLNAIDNVYEDDEIHLYAYFTAPSGDVKKIDAFWFQDYNELLTYRTVNVSRRLEGTVTNLPGDYQLVVDWEAKGDPQYRLRYLTTEPGLHQVHVYVEIDGKVVQTMERSFEIIAADDPNFQGYIRIDSTNQRHFVFDSGKTYMPIGQNVAWYTSKDRKHYDYYTWFSKMGEAGANFARVWMAAWGFSPFWDDVDNYDTRQSNLLSLDKTIDTAEEEGIYLMLTLLHHGMFSALVNPMWPNTANTWYTSQYGANPYATKLSNPAQFFTADLGKEAFKDMLRYVVARYAYSDHLMAWEIFNEVDWVEGYSAVSGTAWHKQMAEFIESIDPYDHLITTSVKGDSFNSLIYNVFKLDAIDFVNVHRYGIWDHRAVLPDRQNIGFTAFSKPIFYSEIGTSGNGGADQIAIDPTHRTLHEALWAGMMGGGAGGGANWWWESWIHPANAYYVYRGAAAFADKLDLSGDYRLLSSAGAQIGSNVKLLGYAVDNRVYAYFYGSGTASFSVPIAQGSYLVSWYNTVDGSLISTQTVVSNGSLALSVAVPGGDVAMTALPM